MKLKLSPNTLTLACICFVSFLFAQSYQTANQIPKEPNNKILNDINLLKNTNNNSVLKSKILDPCTDGAIVGTPTANDPDGDGINNDCDLDDDNDGILDVNECDVKLEETSFSAGNGNSINFSLPQVANGFTLDITRLDNSFNITINGSPLTTKEIQFQKAGTSGQNIRFKDGSIWGKNGVPEIYAFGSNVSSSTPILRFVIDKDLTVKMYGSKTANGELFELELFNGNEFNQISWKENDANDFKVSQEVAGPTYIIGSVYGVFADCDLDSDGINNNLDLDSDGDGCFDVTESGGLDANNDGILDGNGFDTDGKVTGHTNGYNGLSGNESAAYNLTVTKDPTNISVANGEAVKLAIEAKSSLATSYNNGTPIFSNEGNANDQISYQWYLGDPENGGTELKDEGVYSGVKISELIISDVTGLDGSTYYIVINHAKNSCIKEIKNATITIDTTIKASNDVVVVKINSSNAQIPVLANDTFTQNIKNEVQIQLLNNTSEKGGTLSISNNGTSDDTTDDVILYTPATDFLGDDSFEYAIQNTNGATSKATVNVTVEEEISPCIIGAIVGTPTANDPDGDGINNDCDLDDDNDGILDVNECGDNLGFLNYEFYDSVPEGWTVDNIPTEGAYATGKIDNFDVSALQKLVRPGNNHRYSIRYNGFINIKTAGIYYFALKSDDGSKLYINNTEVVNNDGLHAPRTKWGNITLDVGKYPVTVLFFENWGHHVLNLRYYDPSVIEQTSFDIFSVSDEDFCQDTDNDGIKDSVDLDSDGDGCFDVVESGGVDANNDGILDGTSFNNEGKVVGGSGAYNGLSGKEVKAQNTVIVTGLEDKTILEGSSVILSVEAAAQEAESYTNASPVYENIPDSSSLLEYEWYLGDPANGGTKLTDSGIYSETTTSTLNISDVTGLNNNVYYVVVSNKENSCVSVTSNAKLTVTMALKATDDVATVNSASTDNSIDVLSNDSFGSNGPKATALLLVSTTTTEGGSVSINDNNTPNDQTDDTVFYTPNSTFSGTDSFEYTITDSADNTKTAKVEVTVNLLGTAYIPTEPAAKFNLSIENDLTLLEAKDNKRSIKGNVAVGGDISVSNSYMFNTGNANCGTYTYKNTNLGLIVNGKINYNPADNDWSRIIIKTKTNYIKIGEANNSSSWYLDENGEQTWLRVTASDNYNDKSRIELRASAQELAINKDENPVFEKDVFDFASAFQKLRINSKDLARFSNNVQIENTATNEVVQLDNLPESIKINLKDGINILSLKGSDLNTVKKISFNRFPSSEKILIINIDAEGSLEWNVWEQPSLGVSNNEGVLYNFYNTTSLKISGTEKINGSIFAPFADIDKTNHTQTVNGQIIGKSLIFNGGLVECNYFKSEVFTKDNITVPPIAEFTVDKNTGCLAGNSFKFSNTSNTGIVVQPADPLTYLWDFGDGTTSTFMSPTKTYNTAGTFNVSLTVTNSQGSVSKTTQLEVNSVTEAQISENTINETVGNVVKELTLTNNADYDSFSWSLEGVGNNLYENQQTVTFTFTEEGVYKVQLKAVKDGCETTTEYKVNVSSDEVSTGNDGGLESFGLGDALTKRYIQRKKNNVSTIFKKSSKNLYKKQALLNKQVKKSNEQTMLEMFPDELIAGDVAHVTSPTDIIDYTVADEVLSVDFSKDDKTIGVVLGVKTLDQIYNHTKATCDRLRGAEILDVTTIKIGGYNFLQQAIKQRDGNIEHAISFAVGKNTADSNYSLQTNWYVFDYTKSNKVYNFQVWAADPANTKKMTEAILNNLKSFIPVNQTEVQKFPESYATKVYRKGEKLYVDIKSLEENQELELTIEELYSETSTNYEDRYEPIKSKSKQTFEALIYDGYEYNGLIKLNGKVQDAFYHADGNWGLDYDKRYTTIKDYEVTNRFDFSHIEEDQLAVNRNLSVKAYSEYDYLTAYKALLPGTLSGDYTDYNSLVFTATGSGITEITLVKSSIENWSEQYKVTVFLTEEEFTYVVPFNVFSSTANTESIDASDLTTLSFTFVAANAGTNNLDLNIWDVKFAKSSEVLSTDDIVLQPKKNEFFIYPNPSSGTVNCTVFSDINTEASLVIYDVNGKIVYRNKINLNNGKNEFSFNANLKSGVKFLKIMSPEINFGTSKLIIR